MGILNLLTPIHRWFFTPWRPLPKNPNPLRIGLLSTANINGYALILPTWGHPDAHVIACSSRNLSAAQTYAKAWGIPESKAYGTYNELLLDPDVEAVYIGLPNGMHAEWAIKAIQAGKHVLVEKPMCSNADEARAIVAALESKNRTLPADKKLILLEAFHYRFHPFAQTVRSWLQSGVFGNILTTHANACLPSGFVSTDNVRFSYDLAGGALMDLTYAVSVTRFMLGPSITTPKRITSAVSKTSESPEFSTSTWNKVDPRIDLETAATAIFELHAVQDADNLLPKREVTSHISTSLTGTKLWGIIPRFWAAPVFTIETDTTIITMNNFISPHLGHSVTITDKSSKRSRTESIFSFSGEESGGWGKKPTYWYQLDAFVKRVSGGGELGGGSGHEANWVSLEDSVAQMETIDMIYEKSGVGRRGVGVELELGETSVSQVNIDRVEWK